MARGSRTILHVDMDAFYVSVELRNRPELRGKPVVVGGTGNRGVVAAASYEARRYGVFSAMPSSRARRLCPNAIFLPGDHALYAQVSEQVHEIFHGVTPLVEGLALDEAFLDVTGSRGLFGSGNDIAGMIRRRVSDELALDCSVGVAPNKFLAKLASKHAKPIADARGVRPGKGVFEVIEGRELDFLHPLAVRALWGVGPKTQERLERLGIATVGELAAMSERELVAALGKATGTHLHALAWGRDNRAVEPGREMKSIGHEETYPQDLYDPAELHAQLVRLSDAVATRLRNHGVGARTITLKVRFAGFHTVTRSHTAPTALSTGPAVSALALGLLSGIDPSPGVRLLGVSGTNLEVPAEQMSLDLTTAPGRTTASRDETVGARVATAVEAERTWHDASATIDQIRSRFGSDAIAPASVMRRGKIRPVTKGAQQWGPDRDGVEP